MKNLYKIEDELYIVSDKEKSPYCIKECPMAVLNIDRCDCQIFTACSNKVGNIILTTNDLLIKDGVQPIPDEFLEWFIKNPNCEEVEAEEVYFHGSGYYDKNALSKTQREIFSFMKRYKIIIPKEEPKQEVYWIGGVKWNDGTILKTQPFYHYDEGVKNWSSKFSSENKGKFEWINYERCEKPKQETVEEAAENHSKSMWGIYYDDIHPDVAITQTHGEISIEDFIAGYNLAQERMYSEEEKMKRRLKMTDKGLLSSCLSKNIDIDSLTGREVLNIYKAMKDYSEIKFLKQENMYSEEEVLKIIKHWDEYVWNEDSFNGKDRLSLEEWFEQFKNILK